MEFAQKGTNMFSYRSGPAMNSGGATIVVVGLLGVLLLAVALWVAYSFMVTSLVTKVVLSGTYHARNSPRTVGVEKMPKANGREMSLAFWCYLEDSDSTDFFKQVLMIGDSLDSAKMLVVLHKSSNTMYIATRSSLATDGKPIDELGAYINGGNKGGKSPTYCFSVVNYVPLLRWVQIGIVIDHDVLSVYVDGDLYGVTSLDRQVSSASGGNAVFAELSGPLTVGSTSRGFKGYVSKVVVSTYAQSVWQVKALYEKGPVANSWLTSAVGLNGYRLQWPIEKVAAEE